jgi:hypothetical protein
MLGLAFAVAAIGGLEISCFQAPSQDVSFSCDPDDAPKCPEGYTCERDGCCHRDGSDVDANLGACALGGDAGTGTGTGTGTDTDTGTGTDTGTETGTG